MNNLLYQELGRLMNEISKLSTQEQTELIEKSQSFKNTTIPTIKELSKLTSAPN